MNLRDEIKAAAQGGGAVRGEVRRGLIDRLAWRYKRNRVPYPDALERLKLVNSARCKPPLPESEVLELAQTPFLMGQLAHDAREFNG